MAKYTFTSQQSANIGNPVLLEHILSFEYIGDTPSGTCLVEYRPFGATSYRTVATIDFTSVDDVYIEGMAVVEFRFTPDAIGAGSVSVNINSYGRG